MADPYPIDGVQSYHNSWYTFQDSFLEFNSCMVSSPSPRDVIWSRLERRDLLPIPSHFAFLLGKIEDWSGWAKEMLAKNGFVEILHAVEILKLVTLSQTLQISGNVECLRRLVRRWCTSTHTFILAFGEVTVTLKDVANLMLLPIVVEKDPWHITLTLKKRATLVALKKVMKKNASASSRSWRGEDNIDFPTWMRYFRTSQAEGVRLPLALLMLGTLDHMLDLLHLDEILGASYYIIELHVYTPSDAKESDYRLCHRTLKSSRNAGSSYSIHAAVYYMAGGVLTKEDNGQWVPVCLPIPGITKEEHDQAGAAGEELGQEVRDDAKVDKAAPSRRSVLGKRKSVTHPPKSRARRTSASPTNKQSKAKASTSP
ncbi:hypothetical protein SLEP1_g18832 [Rubroshorea leprosula]|uniref:Aminotransferase-like plant mobile domain-containing protein n=1 Tax=Rubroshorea leprosula TaxID=152421 RepID=A0AAV5J4U0_9ROSI|nr:hypothetical protein SLEP1_g18832 [Rubroshorea leprosula]